MTTFPDAGSQSVGAIMATEFYTVTPDTGVASALRLLPPTINHILVLSDGMLAGIVSRNDLLTASVSALVGEHMTSPVFCILPETDLEAALRIMGENDVGCLPVIAGQQLVGMVTRAGLMSLEEEDAIGLVCDACGNCQDVRRDPRAATNDLCTDCLPPLTTAQ